MNAYKCKHFIIQELVSKKVYEAKGEQCWRWFNPIALRGMDKLRERYGPMRMNDWYWGGQDDGRGYHFVGEEKRSEFSGHRHWGSFDPIFSKVTAKEVRIDLLGHEPTSNGVLKPIEGFEEITEIEYGEQVTWFHHRYCSNINGVLVYNPFG